MLLKIFTNIGILAYKDIDKTFFQRRSAGGMMYLQFDISVKHDLYKYIQEETRLVYDNQRYIVKGINERTKANVSTITAELDLTGLNSKSYGNKTFTTQSFHALCSDILSDTGWSVVGAGSVRKRTTIEATDKTPLEILETCTNSTAYNTCYEFDSINKVITCITPYNNTSPRGAYFSDELNLDEVTFKGSSSGLVTRLTPIGKDGLTIASVNNGCKYIDNFSYTTDIIAKTWRDERYTNAQELYDDAVVKLAAASVPERSYTCKVIDLAKIAPEKYAGYLSYDLYDVVTLIDRNRGTRVDHRIVEINEYPMDHTLDTVTLSSIAGKVTGKLNTLENRLTELDAQTLHDRTKVNEIKQDLDTTVLHVSESWASSASESWFTQTADGLYLETSKMLGSTRWSTLLQQSYDAIRLAWNTSSDYIKFEVTNAAALMNFYSTPKTANTNPSPLLSISREGERIYNTDGSLLMVLNSDGMTFSKGQKYVGRMGTTNYSGTNQYGLVFNLAREDVYMAWCHDDSDISSGYNIKWAYVPHDVNLGILYGGSAKNTSGEYVGSLHANCPVNIHGWDLSNAVLKNWGFDGGCISDTFSGKYTDSSNQEKTFRLVFDRGILKSASW